MNIELNYIPKLSDNFIYRYESQINEGVIFIYQIENKKILEGNNDLYKLINLTDGVHNIQQIINVISEEYDTCYDEIKRNILNIYSWLKNENIIE